MKTKQIKKEDLDRQEDIVKEKAPKKPLKTWVFPGKPAVKAGTMAEALEIISKKNK